MCISSKLPAKQNPFEILRSSIKLEKMAGLCPLNSTVNKGVTGYQQFEPDTFNGFRRKNPLQAEIVI